MHNLLSPVETYAVMRRKAMCTLLKVGGRAGIHQSNAESRKT